MQLAQVNIAKLKYSLESPELKDFVDNLDPINALAEQSKGFVWRLKDDVTDNATNFTAFDDPDTIVNMSVWESADDLKNFMFRTHHKDFLKRKKEWFEPMSEANYVLWWIKPGEFPTPEEGIARLVHLREEGESPYAFSFKSNFTADEAML